MYHFASGERGIYYLVVFLFLNILSITFASENVDLSKSGNVDRRSSEDDYRGVMWFGPRLGKRSSTSSGDDRQTWRRLLEAADAVKYYYSKLQDEDPEINLMKKYFFTPQLGRSLEDKKTFADFTPRLGRTLSGEYTRVTPSDRDTYRVESDQMEARPPLFSPRLGRNTVHFSPRLGRELYYDMANSEEDNVRVARSASQKKKPSHST